MLGTASRQIEDDRWQRNRLRGLTLAQRILRRPSWAIANMSGYFDQWRDQRTSSQHIQYETTPLSTGLAAITGADEEAVEHVLARVPTPKPLNGSVLYGDPDASGELVALMYAVCRLSQPQTVVETGVANGITTSSILQALSENAKGTLISIDLPHLHPAAEESIGCAVHPDLRNRWTLHLGPASRLLPRVLRTVPEVDIFVQDAAHTVRGQLSEYRAAWSFLRTGGLLISDDVSRAFSIFAQEVGGEPMYITQAKSSPIGALVKP